MSTAQPRILFFNVNGSGMGHLNRCLSYARRLRGRARCVFFSLASAMEIIEDMGFEGDYFVSHYWSTSSTFAWNSELALRSGLVLEQVRPDAVVFDGTWPFQGFLHACAAYGRPALVWSNRGLLKEGARQVTVDEGLFDLVIEPGELGAVEAASALPGGGRRVLVPPVCLLDQDELLTRSAARQALGLETLGRHVLFSLGPGNLKDVTGIGQGLVREFESAGFRVVWARPPISIRDVELPAGVIPVSAYPLARYLHAFDAFVGAAGYNTCCELVQAGLPALLVPNEQLVDDQLRRARMVVKLIPAVVSSCDTDGRREEAVRELLQLMGGREVGVPAPALNGAALALDGAALAADEIWSLLTP